MTDVSHRAGRRRARRSHPARTERGVFCNRTLNLRAIRAIGYDMDYTLIHYRVEEWERRAYEHIKRKFADQEWPVQDLTFDPVMIVRGLVIDIEQGNVVKADRFGYVKRAAHGTTLLEFDEQRRRYARTMVDLSEDRWVFLNTLFSLSEACLYAQLVDRLDAHRLPGVLGYADLYHTVRASLDETHMEGLLKAEIVADPDRFIELDEETPLTVLDQLHAGKKLLLITNSEWGYTRAVMEYAFDRFLPDDMTWRDLFQLIIVSARKPAFFGARGPFFEVVNEEGLLKPCIRGPTRRGIYLGGNAPDVEAYLGLSGDRILYVGDHMFSDVHASKNVLRWRTALVLRELESEIRAAAAFEEQREELVRLMGKKEELEAEYSALRLAVQRKRHGYGPAPDRSSKLLERQLGRTRTRIAQLDERIAPIAVAAGTLSNERWGPLMRAGNDKSHLARQVERSADIYTSRVSNFLEHTPFVYLRAPRGSLPHDQGERQRLGEAQEEGR